ncbi:MAG: hypothetical protein K1X88_10310 [Nannocystaceae bacterium]|nr:hypothetical protein [Nannocystaceae bacterium]
MDFWRHALVGNVLVLAILLAIAASLRAGSSRWRALAIPDGIVAGALGLALGRSGLDAIPAAIDFGGAVLEPLVYHGFAVVFIAVGLQAAPGGRASGSARSLAFALVGFAVLQSILGFALLAAWAAGTGDALHPGLGFMIMLGFAQGPGQALAFGGAWEPLGLVAGAQIGLLYAALGFGWCCLLGVPLVALGRRRGWLDPLPEQVEVATPPTTAASEAATPAEAGSGATMEPLTIQLIVIGCLYALVFVVLSTISRVLPEHGYARATLWGFHFLCGSSLAIALRRVVDRRGLRLRLDDALLGRIAVTAVDVTTAAALAAIELDALGRLLVPILVMSTCGGVLTFAVSLWLGRRAFPEAPFSHVLMLAGTCTGTIPTGFALLRIVDPQLRGPVARSTVLAATAAVPLGMPLFFAVIPLSASRWSGDWASAIATTLAALAVYFVALVWLWRRTAVLRWLRPWWSAWPRGG